MSADYQTSHVELKVYLLRNGLSQRRIAKELGITVQYLNDILRGRRKATTVRRLLIRKYHIPAQYLELQREAA